MDALMCSSNNCYTSAMNLDIRNNDHLIEITRKCEYFSEDWFLSLTSPLRNLLMPLFNPSVQESENFKWNNQHGLDLLDKSKPLDHRFPFLADIRDNYNMFDLPINLISDKRTFILNTRIFESNFNLEKTHTVFFIGSNSENLDNSISTRILPLLESHYRQFNSNEAQKNLRIISFSFYDNFIEENNQKVQWQPLSCSESSAIAYEALKALSTTKYKPDSLLTHSLGNLIYSALEHKEDGALNILPKKMIFNRGFTSTYKVVQQTMMPLIRNIIYFIAHQLHWTSDPENTLLNYFNENSSDLKERKLIIIKAKEDHYYQNRGDFDSEFIPELQKLGLSVKNGTFYIPQIMPRFHHSAPDDQVINNHETGTNTINFIKMHTNEKLSDSLMREVFMND